MMESRRLLITNIVVTLCLGGLGFFATPIAINVLGFAFFKWHRMYHVAQGLGSALYFLGLMLAPLGAVYGIGSGILMSVAGRRWPEKRRQVGVVLAIGYIALLIVIVLVVGLITIA